MEINNISTIDFQSRYCKNEEHNNCSKKWKGLGVTVLCTCNCHIKLDEKNIVLDGPSKSSNTHRRNDILNLSLETD